MAKKNAQKEIHQPDDVFFKLVMNKAENARGYLTNFVPEWADKLDLGTLEWQKETFQIPNFRNFDADVLYRCLLKETNKSLVISFLWENKSYVSIQIGLYLFLAYHNMIKTKGKVLEPIIPLIFYNGKENWQPRTIYDLFENHEFYSEIKQFLPNFDFHFTKAVQINIPVPA